jgi:hypothetical protein
MSNNPQSAYVLHILHNKHGYGPMNVTMSLLHPAHKGWRMTSLEDFYIQLFQRHNITINKQSQKDTNSLFDLIYDTQLTHACSWSPSTSLTSVVWFQHRVVCQTSSINTPLLGIYFTDSCFISILHYIIFIYQCIINISYTHLFSFLSGLWHTTYYLHISFVTH